MTKTDRYDSEFARVNEFMGNQDFVEVHYKFLGDDKYELICKSEGVVIKRDNDNA